MIDYSFYKNSHSFFWGGFSFVCEVGLAGIDGVDDPFEEVAEAAGDLDEEAEDEDEYGDENGAAEEGAEAEEDATEKIDTVDAATVAVHVVEEVV